MQKVQAYLKMIIST